MGQVRVNDFTVRMESEIPISTSVEMKKGQIIVITEGEFSDYRLKGVFTVCRDFSVETNHEMTDNQREEEMLSLALDGAIRRIDALELWIGRGGNGFKPTLEPIHFK